MKKIKNHDVQSVNIQTTTEKAFKFIADPKNLAKWTEAFSYADENSALMITPNGELKIGLKTFANPELGTIDWEMTMPDGTKGSAFSRVVSGPDGKAIYSFVLLAPPVPLEQLEGALSSQINTLSTELRKLAIILEK